MTTLSARTAESLSDPSRLIVLSYAQTGLGHLRVTDALYRGLPDRVHPLTLHSQDASISYIHRMVSINTATRQLLEWAQRGAFERSFTHLYRSYLRARTHELKTQVRTLIDVGFRSPKHVLFVTTHFFLSHQLAEIKGDIENETGIEMKVIVQVTDDSPQLFWYVPGADLTVVPSHLTRRALEAYGRRAGLPKIRFAVAPYPVSPYLAEKSTKKRFHDRMRQMSTDAKRSVHVAVPISGAAVGLGYYSALMQHLHKLERRFVFHIVSKDAPFTASFLADERTRGYVQVEASSSDKSVVEAYEELYKRTTIALEITKPSEQAFKTLVGPTRNGGAVLLFSSPVGRQEHDNIHFMRRHWLVPTDEETQLLWDMARNDAILDDTVASLFRKIQHYRGIPIPSNPHVAASFIHWAWKRGCFEKMMDYKTAPLEGEHKDELGGAGVRRFWEEVVKIVS